MNINFLKNIITMNRNVEYILTGRKYPYNSFIVRSKTRSICFLYEDSIYGKTLYIDVMKNGKNIYCKTFVLNKYANTDITKNSFCRLVDYLISRYKHINVFEKVMN